MRHMITVYPNKILNQPTRDIPKESIKAETFSQIGSSMLAILRKEGGIGLSANQVGLPLNMCVIELTVSDPKILLNPRITKTSKDKVLSREGCLSLPGAIISIDRYKEVTVEYEDVTGETKKIEAVGLLSSCLQHEIDHLKGVLALNRLGAYHKDKALKQITNYKRSKRGNKR